MIPEGTWKKLVEYINISKFIKRRSSKTLWLSFWAHDQTACVQNPISCVVWGKPLNLSVSVFLSVEWKCKNAHFMKVWGGLNHLTHLKHLAQCPTHGKNQINVYSVFSKGLTGRYYCWRIARLCGVLFTGILIEPCMADNSKKLFCGIHAILN